MVRHFTGRALLATMALGFFLIVGTQSTGYAQFKEPPGAASDLKGKITGEVIALFTGGVATFAVSGECNKQSFVLGPLTQAGTLADFQAFTTQAALEATDLGSDAAPPFCFPAAVGNVGLRIDTVVKFTTQSAQAVVAEVIMKGYQ